MFTLEEFRQVVARTNPLPADLEMLALHTLQGEGGPFHGIDLLALMPGEEGVANDISYLSEDELKDPDMQSNIEAMREVTALARFVAKDGQSNLYGYWLGQPSRPLHEAPIVMLDNEGQFSLLAGGSLIEGVCGDQSDKKTFEAQRQRFEALGITFQAQNWNDWNRLWECLREATDHPDALHTALYNLHRQQRGLDLPPTPAQIDAAIASAIAATGTRNARDAGRAMAWLVREHPGWDDRGALHTRLCQHPSTMGDAP